LPVLISYLKWFDGVFGRFAASLFAPLPVRPVESPRRFLVIRPGGIGDALLLIPSLMLLREAFPEAKISVLAERRNAAAFTLCTAVDALFLYDVGLGLFKALRRRYDVVIDTEQWHHLSALVARLSLAPVAIGFATNNRARLFNYPVAYSQDDYEPDSFCHLLEPLGLMGPWRLPFLTIPLECERSSCELLAPLSGRPFVAIFPGASIVERRWKTEYFSLVAQALVARGVGVVVLGGGEDAQAAGGIAPGAVLNLAARTTLAESAAVIARSALLFAGDSGVLHIAVGLGIPTVALFGPGIAVKWGPKGEGDMVLDRHLPCSPCTLFGTTPSCPVKGRCLTEITPQEALCAVVSRLQWLGISDGQRVTCKHQ
jgi:ADP-heptose:LPS heptosyltransferase